MVIDEIQRVPDLLLAIKESVDQDQRPGRFLLTGSAKVLALRGVPDAMPGRIETVTLWPLSQGEIDGTTEDFVSAAFNNQIPTTFASELTKADYCERITRGGFPEAVARQPARRERFFASYVADLVNRDIIQLSKVRRPEQLRKILHLVAARVGTPLVLDGLASDLAIPRQTITRHLRLLEEVFLVHRIPAWSRNLNTRVTGAEKAFVVDSGVAADLLGYPAKSLTKPGAPLGGLLANFVTMEIARQLSWSHTRARLFHYRTRDKVEVDLILENRRNQVVAIELKAASTVRTEDFSGIRHLQKRLGTDLTVGIVLYTGREVVPFGERLLAVPISALWQLAPQRA